ncbi:Protein-disulfide isomerase [Hydrobacter penzbergensis]|uniref:Protein-disulfide isomerase n=1 Tax=Hydrobacter penzbergensis TaxID=1235997 RepID=A0A8X8IHE5_9BACT|nr:thioredoxin domain-containing protein [Hydrobacter penzbergensis]SDX26913.1 Protein-disulfide isomerase [Hydrobacter penzbergensis]
MCVQSTELAAETDYLNRHRKEIISKIKYFFAFFSFSILSFFFLRRIVEVLNSQFIPISIGVYFQGLILIGGIVVTSLLLWYEMDQNNPLLQKICTGIIKGNCNAILTGKQSKLFTWLSWSELGFFYFTGGLITLFLAETPVVHAIAGIAWLNILALPYTAFSIYYQWKIEKHWCVLCLAVQGLLILGTINSLVCGLLLTDDSYSFYFIFREVLLYLLPALIWYISKPYIAELLEGKILRREYLRVKFNTDIYDILLRKQKQITLPVEGVGIDIGSPHPKNTLIKVCNPYCGPCSKAHTKIEKLLDQFPDLAVKIIFKIANEAQSPSLKVVRHLLCATEGGISEAKKEILNDWYHSGSKDYEKFSLKHPINGKFPEQNEKLEAMDKWCNAMEIRHTPTIFINGYQLPDTYSIEDLQYFLLE